MSRPGCRRSWLKQLLSGLLASALVTPVSAGAQTDTPIKPPQAAGNEFHFVVLGDAQFHDPAKFNRVIDQTRRLRPAFVIQVGDLIEGYNSDLSQIRDEWARFAAQIAPLQPVTYMPVPGNHDVYGSNKKPDADLERIYEARWGPLYYSFQYRNALVVALNSDSTQAINAIDSTQFSWLRETLEGSTAEHKFAFMHRPPFLMKNADQLHDLFRKTDVSHVFYGHHHHYHYMQRDGIHYAMTNASGTSVNTEPRVGGFHHLLQVSVRDAEVNVAVIKADAILPQDYVAPADNYDFFALSRGLTEKTVSLERQSARAFALHLPLKNTTRRDVQLFVACDSADTRWQFEPAAIEPLNIAAGTSHRLSLLVSYARNRVPESDPTCHIRVPMQTAAGQWVDFNHTVTGVRSE